MRVFIFFPSAERTTTSVNAVFPTEILNVGDGLNGFGMNPLPGDDRHPAAERY